MEPNQNNGLKSLQDFFLFLNFYISDQIRPWIRLNRKSPALPPPLLLGLFLRAALLNLNIINRHTAITAPAGFSRALYFVKFSIIFLLKPLPRIRSPSQRLVPYLLELLEFLGLQLPFSLPIFLIPFSPFLFSFLAWGIELFLGRFVLE